MSVKKGTTKRRSIIKKTTEDKNKKTAKTSAKKTKAKTKKTTSEPTTSRKRVKSVSSKATKSVRTRKPKTVDITKKPLKHIEITKELLEQGIDLTVSKLDNKNESTVVKHEEDIFSAPLFYDYDYGKESLVFLPIDPTFGFVYWDFKAETLERAFAYKQGNLVLRFYDLSNINFNGYNANEMWDVKVYGHKGTWYLRHDRGNRNLIVELGVLEFSGVFTPISRSALTYFPSNTVSNNDKILWMTVDEFGNKVISEQEDFTKEDLELLKRLIGEELFETVFIKKQVPNIDGSGFRVITEESVNLLGIGGVSSFFTEV